MNKKLIGILISLSLIAALFAGCANLEGTELLKAFEKVSTINSMESNSKINITLDAQGLSKDEEESFNQVKDLMKDLQINYFTKFIQNQDKTTLKSYSQISTNSEVIPVKTEVWLNQNFSGKTPIAKEIIKSEVFPLFFPPKDANKYLVIDLEQMKKNPETKDILYSIDFANISQSNNELKEKLVEFLDKYVSPYDLGFNFITDKGTANVNGADAHLYELKLSDTNLKTLLRKSINDFSQNKEAMNFIKDYVLLTVKSGGLKGTELTNATKEIEALFTELTDPKNQEEFNSIMDKLDNVTLLGDKGIDITYAINNDGYIVNENGTIQLVLDVKKLNQFFDEVSGVKNTTTQDLTGIYTVELAFETNNYNINTLEDKNIIFPKLTAQNSITLEQLLAELNPKPPVAPTVVLYKKKSAKLYKKVYYVKVSDAVAQLKGKYSYSRGNATIKVNGKTIKLQLGRKYVLVNGKTVKLKTINGIIVKRKLYIPVNVYNLAGVKMKLK